MTDIPKTIKVTVTAGIKGQAITVINRTNGETLKGTLGDTAKAVIELQNFASGYTEGDVIDFIVSGIVNGSNTLTVSGTGPQAITISTSAINVTARGI